MAKLPLELVGRRRIDVVLCEVPLDEFAERERVWCLGLRTETDTIEGGGERIARLALRLEATELATYAVLVAIMVGPRAAGELVDLAELNARHGRCPPS